MNFRSLSGLTVPRRVNTAGGRAGGKVAGRSTGARATSASDGDDINTAQLDRPLKLIVNDRPTDAATGRRLEWPQSGRSGDLARSVPEDGRHGRLHGTA